MVFSVQQLIIKRDTSGPLGSTLTDIHDSNSAWAGLGSALLTLLYQLGFRRQISRTATALLYLGGVAVLHTTIPATISVEALKRSNFTQVMTSGLPILSEGVDGYASSNL